MLKPKEGDPWKPRKFAQLEQTSANRLLACSATRGDRWDGSHFLFALVVAGIFFPPALLFAALLLPFAGVMATRWRFAPLPVGLVSLLTVIFLVVQPHDLYVLTHVQLEFIVLVPMIVLGLVAGVAGIWATVENDHNASDEHRSPRFRPLGTAKDRGEQVLKGGEELVEHVLMKVLQETDGPLDTYPNSVLLAALSLDACRA